MTTVQEKATTTISNVRNTGIGIRHELVFLPVMYIPRFFRMSCKRGGSKMGCRNSDLFDLPQQAELHCTS